MAERITHKTVSFLHPFVLAGVEGEQSAGSYTVETIEEPIDDLSFVAYRRVSTTITLASKQFGPVSRQVITIEPGDLEEAQRRDVGGTGGPASPISPGSAVPLSTGSRTAGNEDETAKVSNPG